MKMKAIKKFSIFLLIFLFVLIPVSPSGIFSIKYFNAKADSATNITGYQIWDTDKTVDNYITIATGSTLIIKPGVKISFKADINVQGTMVVSGTKEKPVIFKRVDGGKWGYAVLVGASGKLIMRNTDVSGGGYMAYASKENSFLNNAMASGAVTGCIDVSGGWLDIEANNFHDNETAIFIANRNLNRVKVNRSKFINNSNYDVLYSGTSGNNLNFQYNWWGSSSGPSKTCDSADNCWYDKFYSEVNFSNWLTSENFHDPVIIVPGILGSWKWTDGSEWKIDPIFKTYNSLIETFKRNGYEENKDLFVFPYQWRDSNINNAKLLQGKIAKIKQKTNWPKVDVVAHSMGGLLVREYIESNYYQNDIDQFVTLGTPHNGAPEDYLVWDGGEMAISKTDLQGILFEKVFKQEAKEQGYDSIFDYLHNMPIKSVQELLPVYDYLYDVSLNSKRSYANKEHYPENNFLENLNYASNLNKLNDVEFTNIVGKLDNNKTINEIRVGESSENENFPWAHGYPENFDSLFGDHGLRYGNGDGTVPLESSENIVSDKKIEIISSHKELPAKSADLVYETLTGAPPVNNVTHTYIDKILAIFVFSPIDIQVISPSGERVGKDFENGGIINEIDGAYYTGFDTENEFLTIPNPEDGEYQILTQGTGNGDYKIKIAKISENENDSNATESEVEITGTAANGVQDEKKIEVAGNEVSVKETKDITPPIITAEILEEPNESGWYKNNVTVRFTAEDSESGVEGESQKDVVIYDEGKNLSATATFSDKAGNISSKTVSGINIDKTAPAVEITSPEEKSYLNNQIIKINYSAIDANGNMQQVFFDGKALNNNEIDLSLIYLGEHIFSVSATDEAGNETKRDVTLKTVTDSDAIVSNVGHYYNLRLISNKNAKKFLETKLKNIQKTENLLSLFENSLLPKWAREIVIENLKKIINNEIDRLILQIKNQKNISKNITTKTKTLLIESLSFIKK